MPKGDRERRAPRQYVLAVESTEWLTPHLVRVVASGGTLDGFGGEGYTDAYVKLLFVDPALGLEPPYDLAALRATLPADRLPVVRTYTVRWVDRTRRRLAIDFVTHGDTGVAAVWAAGAAPGDRLVLSGPGGAYAPDPAAGWHLFAGDLSALPAIAAALETLPGHANGVAHVEVGAAADILDLKVPEQVAVNWLVNPDPADTGFLARAVDGGPWPAGPYGAGAVQVFAHGERESVKAVRQVLRDRGVPREAISISGYWARGRTEDVFQAEKREPVGRID
ncbi:siderophore-interacting protein [Phytohabitans sp. ZYX-F-186]|uniref:Siderophore-interacting protein n=1 Tax=Phytohabitans maris TaxID=3071409 RepID=A0ABU0ZWW4_9ACTN|nr:siderophore-interacting protein [Phytohabitans sp. ZYX-F-186]MDQ7910700.1 siderophore-interacting protein [Phytohabitans sp. ZYX-F-186]